MKKLISIICALVMVLSMMGCQQQAEPAESTSAEDYSNTTLTGKVTAIDGTVVTLQLGELTETDRTTSDSKKPSAGGSQTPGKENSNGDAERPSSNGGEDTPPEMPSGEEGEAPSEVRASKQGGEEKGSASPKKADDEKGAGGKSSTQSKMSNSKDGKSLGGSVSSFTPGEETATLDLNGAAVTVERKEGDADGSISDISEDDILVIVVGENNAAATVTVKYIRKSGSDNG